MTSGELFELRSLLQYAEFLRDGGMYASVHAALGEVEQRARSHGGDYYAFWLQLKAYLIRPYMDCPPVGDPNDNTHLEALLEHIRSGPRRTDHLPLPPVLLSTASPLTLRVTVEHDEDGVPKDVQTELVRTLRSRSSDD